MGDNRARVLTTHAGSLPRPPELAEVMVGRETGELPAADAERLPALVRDAIVVAVRQQVDTGLDIISDGEMGKIGSATYMKERLSGFDGEATALNLADLADFPEFTERALAGLVTTTPACTGPITYTGRDQLDRELADLRGALAGTDPAGVFVPAASPGLIGVFLANQHYPDHESYLDALAEAMRVEYEAIAAAGFTVQLDCPDLAMGWHSQYADLDVAGFRARVAMHIEALNRAVRDIAADRLRMHVCWGNYQGPHHRDIELVDILDLLYRAKPQGLMIEAANPRHGHEWRVFEDIPLPDDKVLVPGVIDTSTNYIEHPDLVAERICRYAGIVGPERVLAGTDCGFATFASFLSVQPAIAWAKLGSLVEGARRAATRLHRPAASGPRR
jgi:5-methyltetrahydropteroyltriglutamate--homocysteine methyltransferase